MRNYWANNKVGRLQVEWIKERPPNLATRSAVHQAEVLWWCCCVHSWIFSPGFCTLLSEGCRRFYVCVIQTQSWFSLWFSWQQICTHRNLSWLLYIILYWRSSKNNKADRLLQKPVSLISSFLFTKLVYIYTINLLL